MSEELAYVGRYKIIKKLGQGGEGCVYLAKDEGLDRLAALKRVWDNSLATEAQLRREAAFLQAMRHPMLPVVYDLLWDDAWYLVMEYIEGISLHNYIEKYGMTDEAQARMWAGQLLSILQYLHTRKPPVIYQDLKPENIMVCPDGNLRLVDFGAACYRNYSGNRDIRRAVSVGYAAPELLQPDGRGGVADERSDIFAFGRVMYYMLTGANPAYPPFAKLPVTSYAPQVSRSLEQMILKCMQEDPAKRYQVVEDIADALNRKREKMGYGRRQQFIRKVEKRVALTEKKSVGLAAQGEYHV
jgi:serine/threonine-protein kinase